MATTQYIGARYVPVFADPAEWNNTRTYEPLTIVMHNGNSYTSAQYVPKGIDISNEVFWKLTGNYNSQVEQYRKEVATYDGRITANADAITTEKNRATAAEKVNADAITTEKNRAAAAEKVNADAITKINSKHYAILIGDSFTAKVYTDITGVWATPVCKALGVSYVNYAISGKGFIAGSDTEKYTGQLQKAYDESTDRVVDYVFICGCLNDLNSNSLSDITAAAKTTIAKAQSLFPKAKIIVIGPNVWDTFNLTSKCSTVQGEFALASACATTGAFFISSKFMGAGTGRYTNNGHPDSALQTHLGTLVKNAICGNHIIDFTLMNSVDFVSDVEGLSGVCSLKYSAGKLILSFTITTTSEYVPAIYRTLTFPNNYQFGFSNTFMGSIGSGESVTGYGIITSDTYKEASKLVLWSLAAGKTYYGSLIID